MENEQQQGTRELVLLSRPRMSNEDVAEESPPEGSLCKNNYIEKSQP